MYHQPVHKLRNDFELKFEPKHAVFHACKDSSLEEFRRLFRDDYPNPSPFNARDFLVPHSSVQAVWSALQSQNMRVVTVADQGVRYA